MKRIVLKKYWVIAVKLECGKTVYRQTCKGEYKGGICFLYRVEKLAADRYETREEAEVAIRFVTGDFRNKAEPEEL